jgi:lipoprotein-releasing system permease protein
MAFEYFIGRRYLRARQKQAFITLISILSMAGITVGVMALIVVIGVMKGFEDDLRTRILGGQSHIVVKSKDGPITGYHRLVEEIEKIDGVVAATPFNDVQGVLRSRYSISPARIKGIDPATAGRVIKTLEEVPLLENRNLTGSDTDEGRPPAIVLARELARNLGAKEGDIISLISPGGLGASVIKIPVMKQFKISGFFKSGLYEYDSSFAYIHIKDSQRVLRFGDAVTGIEVRVENIFKARKVSESIDSKLDSPYRAEDWMQLNKSLFQAMKTERRVMFIILTLTILVAAFSVASTLIMLVIGKTRDIAILKAMGATDKSIRKIFVFNGMVIGLIGTGLGLCLGLLLATILKHYDISHLTGGIYYLIDSVPVKLEILDILSIIAATLVICYLATLYPARQAARTNPVDSIRFS